MSILFIIIAIISCLIVLKLLIQVYKIEELIEIKRLILVYITLIIIFILGLLIVAYIDVSKNQIVFRNKIQNERIKK